MAYTTIDKSTDYFNTKLYSGTGSGQSITGVGFQPDLWWNKSRSGTHSAGVHCLYDSVRGVTKRLKSDSTDAEATISGVTAFDSDGVTLGSENQSNGGSTNYVAWNWLAANGTASNADGSITSTVSANTTSGFSIVSYTGDGSSGATVGHGLGSEVKFIMIKNRDAAQNWMVGASAVGFTQRGRLNTTDAFSSTSAAFNDTAPTSSVFTLGGDGSVNASGEDLIAYCFAEKQGFSNFGSYIGNGNADGTFVFTGFKPAFTIIKQSSAAGQNWFLTDNKRDEFNVVDELLYADSSNAEVTTGSHPIDFLSNGFKCRGTGAGNNGSGSKYIYMAFAENPFVTSTAIAGTAR